MRRPLLFGTGLAGLLAALGAPAAAGELWGGVYAHDVEDVSIGGYESGPQLAAGAISAPIDALRLVGRPSVHALGALNSQGGTNYAAAGLSWRVPLGRRAYVRPGLGVGVHDGEVDLPSPYAGGLTPQQRYERMQRGQHELDLGSRVLVELELALGWQVSERVAFEASWLHLSHGQFSGGQNPGLSDLGVRVVYQFGAR